MALNGNMHHECNYASNPYHECTESCFRKVAEGKGRKDKKKTDTVGARKAVGLNKNYERNRERRDCAKASNPYHDCDEYCSQRNAGAKPHGGLKESGSFVDSPLKLAKGKKNESEPKFPRELGKASAQVSPYTFEGSKPPSRMSSSDKVELENGENHSSSFSKSGDFQFENSSVNKEQVHSPPLVPTSGILSRPEDTKVNAKKAADSPGNDEMNHAEAGRNISNVGEVKTGSGSRTLNLTMLGVDNSEESDGEDTESNVSVGKYRVKERLSLILRTIFDKYGDIAANCQLESIVMRSYFLESVCSVVHELQSTSVNQLTKSKLKEILAIVKDVESAGIDVGWLRSPLMETAEAIELINQHRAYEVAKAECKRDIESTWKKLESQLEELAIKEKELTDFKKVVAETRARLRELELKSSVLSESIGSIKTKVETFQNKLVLDGVF